MDLDARHARRSLLAGLGAALVAPAWAKPKTALLDVARFRPALFDRVQQAARFAPCDLLQLH